MYARTELGSSAGGLRSDLDLGGSDLGKLWVFGGWRQVAWRGGMVQLLNDVHLLDLESSPPAWHGPALAGASACTTLAVVPPRVQRWEKKLQMRQAAKKQQQQLRRRCRDEDLSALERSLSSALLLSLSGEN